MPRRLPIQILLPEIILLVLIASALFGWQIEADKKLRVRRGTDPGWLLRGEVLCRSPWLTLQADSVFLPDTEKSGGARLRGNVTALARGMAVYARGGSLLPRRPECRFFKGRVYLDDAGAWFSYDKLRAGPGILHSPAIVLYYRNKRLPLRDVTIESRNQERSYLISGRRRTLSLKRDRLLRLMENMDKLWKNREIERNK